MELYDNAKLVGFLKDHGIEIISCTPDSITVNTLFGDSTGSHYQEETIAASMPAVRAYLNY